MNRSAVHGSFWQSLASAFVAGVLAGLIFLAIGLYRHGAELLLIAPWTSYAVWVLVKSVALYGLLFGGVGVLLGAVAHGLGRAFGRAGALVFPLVLGLLVAGTVFVYLSAWWQLEVLAGLPFGDAERLSGAIRHGLAGVGIGAVIVALGFLLGRLRQGASSPAATVRRAVVSLAVCCVLLGISQITLRTGDSGIESTHRPSQVVVVGLDALSFRIMSPMLRAGELPTFRRLMDEGAWGSYLTYGQASSPMVWTTMATGKRVRKHGINDFVTKSTSGYGVQPIKSNDRQSRALWNILSDFDRRVGIIDWLITYPPEEVNGYVITRLHYDEPNRCYPPELNAEIDGIKANVRDYGDKDRTHNFSQVDHVFESAELLLAKEHIDFLAMFEGVSDWVEHRYWKYYEPELFDPELWEYDAADVERLGSLIPETYAHLDRRLGELMQQLDEDALLLVVSDHGQKAVAGRQVTMRMNRVLDALGYAELTEGGEGRSVDYAHTRAYASVETPWAPIIGVSVNRIGREVEGIVEPAASDDMIQELVADLREVRFENGTAVFGAVYATDGGDAEAVAAQSDIVVTHSRFTRSDRYSQETILVGGQRHRLDDFLDADTKISGGHDHQGVIFAHGKGVRPGPIGQLVVSTALQEMVWHLTDKIDALDPWLPVLGRLGFIERATTLDLTPTILHAFGLPLGEDMCGRALADVLDTGEPVSVIASYELEREGGRQAESAPAGDVQSDDAMMQRLKALGYVD